MAKSCNMVTNKYMLNIKSAAKAIFRKITLPGFYQARQVFLYGCSK